ncbi:MAG TPA: PIG-L family deacetylase [Acidimicrobiales bacterium]|nr:PIG-L family deacetylase [Acidimicrobiales bacterium]
MTETARPRLLGMFAHPDDETFCAGGTLATYADRGAETMVVSATRGEAGQIRDAALATRRTLGQVREQELRDACALLGVEHVACFDHSDGTLEDHVDRLRAEVGELIRDFRPDVVLTFGDDGAYGHPDHVAISRATTDAFDDFVRTQSRGASEDARPSARLYHSHFPRSRLLMSDRLARWLAEMNSRFKGTGDFAQALSLFAQESTTMGYANDFVDVSWFPPRFTIVEQGEPASCLYLLLSGEVDVVQDRPDGNQHRLARLGPGEFFGELGVAHHTQRSANVVAVDAVTCLVLSPTAPTQFAGRGRDARFTGVPVNAADGVGPAATTVIDVSEQVDRKVAAIAAHRTQFPIDPTMFPASMLRDMFGTEHFVRVHPPPRPETELLPFR